ncbi:MAG: hypothetical protein GF320_04085 [Armatimonadia bacterium]|nr:hypothetical protein [Armatimonadia bacterium]
MSTCTGCGKPMSSSWRPSYCYDCQRDRREWLGWDWRFDKMPEGQRMAEGFAMLAEMQPGEHEGEKS